MIWLITQRELREIIRDHNLLVPIFVMPTLMGLLAGMAAFGSAKGAEGAVGSMVGALAVQQLSERTIVFFANLPFGDQDRMIALMLKAVSIPLFWVVPIALTSAVAADSFVGEKERHTLEPLLATPVTDREVFFAKLLTAVIPAVIGTWLGMLIFAVLVALSRTPYYPTLVLLERDWAFSMFVIVPLMATLSAGAAALISSRVGSFRAAYQLNGLMVLPVILYLIPQTIVLFLITPAALLYIALGIAVVDAMLIMAALAIFDRERILKGSG